MPTMNDVARLAGVSRGTVSNYINGVQVKLESQQRIQAAITELNYVPNSTARELKLNRSNFVVFILPTTRTSFFAELTQEIQQMLKQKNYKMLLCTSQNDIAEELEYIQMAKEQKVAGILTISYSDLGKYLTNDVPIVSIENHLTKTIPCVSSDNYAGGCLAAKQLLEKGAKNLLILTRSTEKTAVNYGQRAQGFIDYCQHKQVDYTVFDSPYHEDRFYPQLQTFLMNTYQKACPFDGIFAVSDQYADFSYTILRQLGHAVPQSVQLIGFDGGKMYPEQKYFLSSIRQPVKKIAEQCVSRLEELLRNKENDVKKTTILPIEFVQGETTKK